MDRFCPDLRNRLEFPTLQRDSVCPREPGGNESKPLSHEIHNSLAGFVPLLQKEKAGDLTHRLLRKFVGKLKL